MPTKLKTQGKPSFHSHSISVIILTNRSTGASNAPSALPDPRPYLAITVDTIRDQIGLVQEFFLKKLQANGDKPLIEDDDLPVKQRMPKPRLPPTGKITSPRKRPFKEPGPGKGHPRKKMKLNEAGDAAKIGENEGTAGAGAVGEGATGGDPVKKALSNGEGMLREPSRTGEGSMSSTTFLGNATAKEKPLTNGVLPVHRPADGAVDSMEVAMQYSSQTLGKPMTKEVNGDSLPSPESLGAS